MKQTEQINHNSNSDSKKERNLNFGQVCQGLKWLNIPEDALLLVDEIHDGGLFSTRSNEEKFVSMFRMNVEAQGMI
jgi:hypothetical protein